MRKGLLPLLGLLLCGCSETVCEPCQSVSAPTCERPSSETTEEKPIEEPSSTIASDEGDWKNDAKVIFVADTYRYADQDAYKVLYREFSGAPSWGIEIYLPNQAEPNLVKYVCVPYKIFYKEAEQ